MRIGCAAPKDSAPSQEAQGWNRKAVATLALLSFAMLIVSLDQYIVVVAPPEIGRDLGYSRGAPLQTAERERVLSSGEACCSQSGAYGR